MDIDKLNKRIKLKLSKATEYDESIVKSCTRLIKLAEDANDLKLKSNAYLMRAEAKFLSYNNTPITLPIAIEIMKDFNEALKHDSYNYEIFKSVIAFQYKSTEDLLSTGYKPISPYGGILMLCNVALKRDPSLSFFIETKKDVQRRLELLENT